MYFVIQNLHIGSLVVWGGTGTGRLLSLFVRLGPGTCHLLFLVVLVFSFVWATASGLGTLGGIGGA